MPSHTLSWDFDCGASIISVSGTANLFSIVAGTMAGTVFALSADGKPIWDEPFDVDNEVWATSISGDGQYIAVGTANKQPLDGALYVLTRSRNLFWCTKLRSPVWNIKFSVNGEYLVATTWKNELYVYRRCQAKFVEAARIIVPGKAGLYGCDILEKDRLCVVASYEQGLYFYTFEGELVKEILHNEGIYNIKYCAADCKLFVGSRNGSFGTVTDGNPAGIEYSMPLSQRPICGISATGNGDIIAAGSFDGRVIVSNSKGEIFWQYRTKGEVWSIVISHSGTKVVAGCGDHILRAFANTCNSDAYQEISVLEKSIEGYGTLADPQSFETLLTLYRKYEMSLYGYNKLKKLFDAKPGVQPCRTRLKEFLSGSIKDSDDDPILHYNLGLLFYDEKRFYEAIRHFQLAALDRDLRSLAQRKVSESFAELGLITASTSAYRQSRVQHLDYESRHVLFSLAQSYEDSSQWRKAAKLYEMLLSWDIEFRNSYDRLRIANGYASGSARQNGAIRRNNTGVSTSLLGTDASRNADEKLNNVLEARSKELLVGPENIKQARKVAQDLLSDEVYSQGIKRDIAHLDYDKQLFLKYEFGLPEDEMKKFLETVNAYEFFDHARGLGSGTCSLDVGSATGRYPSLLTRLGFKAYGIDIERRAIAYASEKKGTAEWPRYICGDCLLLDQFLPIELDFDLITCMMGTFEHLCLEQQGKLVNDLYRRTTDNGVCLISLWDPECAHLAYLSMYDEGQKELIRQNSRTQGEMEEMFERAGFERTKVIPFALMPQTLIYDLGIERFREEDVEIATQADLAARSIFSIRHGEMFLIAGFKGNRPARSESLVS